MGHWVSTFIAGGGALIASWVLSGCLGIRVGNHVEYQKNPDQISGYYKTEPFSLKVCAQHSSVQCNENVSVSKIPSAITSVMSNPVALIVKDLSLGDAYLVESSGKGNALPIQVEANNKLFFLGQTDPIPVWEDKACTSQLVLMEEGAFSIFPEKISEAGKLPITGVIDLKLMLTTAFQGSCNDTLNSIQSCYLDVNKCGGSTQNDNEDLHAAVVSLFSDYIDAGVMDSSDILQLKSLAFEVLYK